MNSYLCFKQVIWSRKYWLEPHFTTNVLIIDIAMSQVRTIIDSWLQLPSLHRCNNQEQADVAIYRQHPRNAKDKGKEYDTWWQSRSCQWNIDQRWLFINDESSLTIKSQNFFTSLKNIYFSKYPCITELLNFQTILSSLNFQIHFSSDIS